MKNVLIMGATGMVGKMCLINCLDCPEVKKVTIIVRKSTNIKHKKLTEVIHDNFYDYSKVNNYMKNQDICIYCLGVYTSNVSKKDFIKVTVDMTKVFATELKKQSPKATFCFLSASGADTKEKSLILFSRAKGQAENILKTLKFNDLYIFRPGYIYPTIPRNEPNIFYILFRLLYKPLIHKLGDRFSITSEQLAKAMIKVSLCGNNKKVLENADINRVL